jgi:hypothetical protein
VEIVSDEHGFLINLRGFYPGSAAVDHLILLLSPPTPKKNITHLKNYKDKYHNQFPECPEGTP